MSPRPLKITFELSNFLKIPQHDKSRYSLQTTLQHISVHSSVTFSYPPVSSTILVFNSWQACVPNFPLKSYFFFHFGKYFMLSWLREYIYFHLPALFFCSSWLIVTNSTVCLTWTDSETQPLLQTAQFTFFSSFFPPLFFTYSSGQILICFGFFFLFFSCFFIPKLWSETLD